MLRILLEEEKARELFLWRKKESRLSCFWKNLESKFWLCIHGRHTSMKRVISGKRKSREIIVLCFCDQAFGVTALR